MVKDRPSLMQSTPPYVPVGEEEFKGFGDTLVIVVDVRCHVTKLVAPWQCEGTIRDDSRVNAHTL